LVEPGVPESSQASREQTGRFGITTEAYGPFLALCEVEFTSGERALLDHYCDFDMGALVGN
jgi:pYEATS domain-containing protein involved in immunity